MKIPHLWQCFGVLTIAFFLLFPQLTRAIGPEPDLKIKNQLQASLGRPFSCNFGAGFTNFTGLNAYYEAWWHRENNFEVPAPSEKEAASAPPVDKNQMGSFYLHQADFYSLKNDKSKANDLYKKAEASFLELLSTPAGQTRENYISYARAASAALDDPIQQLQLAFEKETLTSVKIQFLWSMIDYEVSGLYAITLGDVTNLDDWDRFVNLKIYDAETEKQAIVHLQNIVAHDNQILALSSGDQAANAQKEMCSFFREELETIQKLGSRTEQEQEVHISLVNKTFLFFKDSSFLANAPWLFSRQPASPEHLGLDILASFFRDRLNRAANFQDFVKIFLSLGDGPSKSDRALLMPGIQKLMDLGDEAHSDSGNKALEYALLIQIYLRDSSCFDTVKNLYSRDPDRCFIPLGIMLSMKELQAQTWNLVGVLKALDHAPALEVIRLNIHREDKPPMPNLAGEYEQAYRAHPQDYCTVISYVYFQMETLKEHGANVLTMLDEAVTEARLTNNNGALALALATKAVAQGLNDRFSDAQATAAEAVKADNSCDLAKHCVKILSGPF